MSVENQLADFFKPEARSAGSSLANKDVVRLSRPSDLEVSAYVKASTSIKVSIRTDSFESSKLSCSCGCPMGKKGQLCKHVWATLLEIEEKYADFLEGKTEIEVSAKEASSSSASTASPSNSQARPAAASQAEFLAGLKKKQADHRKEQYQKQKQRLKEMKQGQGKKKSNKTSLAPQIPEEVEKALEYFAGNGFPLESSFTIEDVRTAKKKLSRVFHPDIGGSHEEIVTLNDNFEVLIQFLEQ